MSNNLDNDYYLKWQSANTKQKMCIINCCALPYFLISYGLHFTTKAKKGKSLFSLLWMAGLLNALLYPIFSNPFKIQEENKK